MWIFTSPTKSKSVACKPWALVWVKATFGYVFFDLAHVAAVRELITTIIGKDIYGSSGFQALDGKEAKVKKSSKVVECFRVAGCIQYGSPRDLIVWEPAVIHLEMQLQRDGSLVDRNKSAATTERYIVGTHTPIGFLPRELLEIGCIADQGFFFHPYRNANRQLCLAADTNSVHKKSTQYKIARLVPPEEKLRAAALNTLNYDEVAASWSPARRRCYTGRRELKKNE